MQACAAALRAERARIAGQVRQAENVRAASRRTAGATFARTRWLACMQRADALASMHAARSARGCVCGGMRTNTSFEIQAPGVRSPKKNGFVIGVFLLMCPPCLHRQSSPPCAQFDHRHLLVRVLRHRCPRAARPLVWSFTSSLSAKLQFSSFAPKRWKNALFRKKKRHHVTPQIRN